MLLQVEEFLYQENLTVEWASIPTSATNNNSSGGAGGGASGGNGTPGGTGASTTQVETNSGPYFAFAVKNAVGFHRLWSALSFLFCIVDGAGETAVSAGGGEVPATATLISNEAEFGHGFTIAGCMLLHLLGQRATFEVLDFSNYVLQMDAHETRMKAGTAAAEAAQLAAAAAKVDQSLVQETNCFLASAKTQQLLQLQLFALFEVLHKTRDSYTKHSTSTVKYHPPAEA